MHPWRLTWPDQEIVLSVNGSKKPVKVLGGQIHCHNLQDLEHYIAYLEHSWPGCRYHAEPLPDRVGLPPAVLAAEKLLSGPSTHRTGPHGRKRLRARARSLNFRR